jgi:ribosomal-protein-alanine N-acetyltransferase
MTALPKTPLPERLAALHASAFDGAARWSAAAFRAAAANPICFLIDEGETGFALGRSVADEAELLTLVVAGDARRRGVGATLLAAFESEARRRGAEAAFLEVAADNAPARRLYERAGWRVAGQRSGYYDGTDAIAMRKRL